MKLLDINHNSARKNKLDDSMIPAINIVFLLLIFFMLAGQIEARSELLQIPVSSSKTALSETRVEIKIDANGRYFVNDQTVEGSLSEHLGKFVLTAETAIICHVHRDLPASALDPVLAIVGQLGIQQLSIATANQS